MKKEIIIWLIVSMGIMLLLPWLAVTFVKSDAGMAIMFLLFFAVNPMYSIATGVFAVRNIKSMWSLPVISAMMFLIGVWVFLDMGEGAFVLYAVAYIVMGVAAMLAAYFFNSRRRR